jgi:hypothetical protein
MFCQFSYGGEEEDEENMDDNEATIDAPAVSGCAGRSPGFRSYCCAHDNHSYNFFILFPGEEEVPMEHPDGDSL